MAATVDGFADFTFQTISASSSVSVPYTTTAGTDGLLLMIAFRQFMTLGAITFDGIALTQVGPVVSAVDGFNSVTFYKLANPPIKTADLVISQAGGAGDGYVWLQPCCTHGTNDDVIDVASIKSDAPSGSVSSQSVPLAIPAGRVGVGILWASAGGGNTITWDNGGVYGGSGSNTGRLFKSAYGAGPETSFGYAASDVNDSPVLLAGLLAEDGGAQAIQPMRYRRRSLYQI